MKNYGTIVDEIKRNAEIAKELDDFVKSAKWSERNESKIVDAAKQAEYLKIKNQILHDNARRAYFENVLPIILKELYKYAGKSYGEKTKEKIRNAVKEKANCSFYIEHSYIDTLHIIPLDSNGYSNGTIFLYNDFEVYTTVNDGKRANMIDANNKIVELPIESFYLENCPEYVENVDKRVKEIIDAFNAAKAARAELEKACSKFNSVTPAGIKRIYANDFRNFLI